MTNDSEYEDVEMEIGGTAGRTHADVLAQTVGRERMLRALTSDGPPEAPRKPRAEKED